MLVKIYLMIFKISRGFETIKSAPKSLNSFSSLNPHKTAKNANMTAIGVLWGFRDEKELRENGADFIVKEPLEIINIIPK